MAQSLPAWRWIRPRNRALAGARVAVVDRHWPAVRRWSVSAWRFAVIATREWRDCAVRGARSMIELGPAAVFLMIWSGFISAASVAGVVCVLLGLGAGGAAIRCLGYTPGLSIVGLFGILIMWIYGNLWITGMLLIVGGSIFSHNRARVLVLMSTAYAIYCVVAHVGWLGIFLSFNLSFFSNDFLNKLLEKYDGSNEGTHFEEQKEPEPEPTVEDFYGDSEYSSLLNETVNVASSKPSCEMSDNSIILDTQKNASCSKAVKIDSTAVDEIKRIMNSSNHYDALGFPRNRSIDPEILKREYRTKARLVHPDKNMGCPLASESFKKLQSAYEVLSDPTKKINYDEQYESGKMSHMSRGNGQQDGVVYYSEESRRIECTKCGNPHIWICTSRSKARARWCQDCSQYHQARDGDGWVEMRSSFAFSTPQKVDIPRAFVCAESKIFDVSEWATCQGMACRPNTHQPSFLVKMVGLNKMVHRSYPSRYTWSLDAEMMPEDEFDLLFQQVLSSGLFSDTAKQRRKSWSPFKIHQKGMKLWRRFP